jgi:putative pyruvate formate lyase activating enzyme
MSFIGGNPDESFPSILEFLKHAPEAFSLPIVWNHHAYVTEEAIDLLEHVVDVFVPDLKYGSDECALRLSGVKHYCATVQKSLRRQLAQCVPVIVRVLVLPGHDQCCHRPALEFLASLPQRDLLEVSIRGQYAPDWKISSADGPLAFRSTKAEWRDMQEYATRLGLKVIDTKRPA